MKRTLPVLMLGLVAAVVLAKPEPTYKKEASRVATIVASLKASGLPTLEGKWHYIGPFDNTDNLGIDTPYPPEKEFDLAKKYEGKSGKVGWQEFKDFALGKVVNL